jgi:hypothetical protein
VKIEMSKKWKLVIEKKSHHLFSRKVSLGSAESNWAKKIVALQKNEL